MFILNLWSLSLGRNWLDYNWCIYMGARRDGEKPGFKAEGGIEAHQNSIGWCLT